MTMSVDTAPEAPLTRAEVIEALANLCRAAKREMRVVGTEALPTPWDRRHRAIDERLTELDNCKE